MDVRGITWLGYWRSVRKSDVVMFSLSFCVFRGICHAGCLSSDIVLGEDALTVFMASNASFLSAKIIKYERKCKYIPIYFCFV